eukprot:scaffold330_cov246-Pinguiococcus_pyrenoidosus.AAC.8
MDSTSAGITVGAWMTTAVRRRAQQRRMGEMEPQRTISSPSAIPKRFKRRLWRQKPTEACDSWTAELKWRKKRSADVRSDFAFCRSAKNMMHRPKTL